MQLIRIEEREGKQLTSAKDLYNFLELDKSNWKRWSEKNIVNDELFLENVDYTTLVIMTNGNETNDYSITIDMAKELAMLCRSEKGRDARKYFIQCEKAWNSPEMILSRANQIQSRMLDNYKDKVSMLESKIQEDKPRVSFAETIEKSADSILIKDLSDLISNEGIKGLGQNNLYKWMREKGYICKNNTKPTRKALDKNLFTVTERIISTVKGDKVSLTTKVTGKGQIYFIEKIKGEYNVGK